MKKAVFYARVSSDIQHKERSIESQLAELRRQVEKAGHELVKEYVDDGYSGALLDRPAMNDLRNDLKSDKFETIYILNADRIARDVTYQNIIVGEILRHKKQLIINGKDYISNPENKFTLTVLGAVSELERAKLIERVTRGRQYRLKQGILLSNGHHLYGYTYSRKTKESCPSYAINEAEAKVVRYTFETYAKGQIGIHTISRQLERMGVSMIKGRNLLNQSSLRGILANRTYLGVRYFNTMKESRIPQDPLSGGKKSKREYTPQSEWIGIKIPAIISQELYDKAQKRLEYNKECYRNSKRPQLLSQLVWCGKCGSRCFAYRRRYQYPNRKNQTVYRRVIYKCNSKTAGVHNAEMNSTVLESVVWDMVRDSMLDPKRLYETIEFIKRRKRANHVKVEKQLRELDTRLHNLSAQKKRIVDLYGLGELEHEEYTRRVSGFDKEVTTLQEKRDGLIKLVPLFQKTELIQFSVDRHCQIARERFDLVADFSTKRQFLLDFLTKVTYSRPNKATTKIKVFGSIPVEIEMNGKTETVWVEFKIERTIDWHEFMARISRDIHDTEEYWRSPVSCCTPELLAAGRKQARL